MATRKEHTIMTLEAMGFVDSHRELLKTLVNAQAINFPELKACKSEITLYLDKYLGWDAIKNDIARVYQEFFSVQDMENLLNFYKTETGKKLKNNQRELIKVGTKVGTDRLAGHEQELIEIFERASNDK